LNLTHEIESLIINMQALSVTRNGLVRANNEDCAVVKRFVDDSILIAVADGMGGHAAGELAARITITTLSKFESERDGNPLPALQNLVDAAQKQVFLAAHREMGFFGMGTTLTAAYVRNRDAYWVHVGDTRLYLFREHRLLRVTSDHTIPGVLLARGEIDYEQARLHPRRNILMRCIGCAEFESDAGQFELKERDLVFISTDGLHDLVPEETIIAALQEGEDLESKLEGLVETALAAGGTDNITVAAISL
jgi:protein phosphatase